MVRDDNRESEGVEGVSESMRTLLGSFTRTYLPSGCFMHMSATVRTMPHPLARDTLSCAAKSAGRVEVVLRITWRVDSRGLAREIQLQEKLRNVNHCHL